MMRSLLMVAALAAQHAYAIYPYNSLAATPQMGWDNWNAFACDVSEDLLLGTARSIVEYGLRDVGYQYIILDDCWAAHQRNATGHLVANSTRFPNGMLDVSNKIHDMGLKFGMYSSAGEYTCARYPASLGHETIDAQTFASWGVDYLKYDNCYNNGENGTPLNSFRRYKVMSDALLATGRPILYSLCQWGQDQVYQWAQTMSNSWRMSGDITDSFDAPDPRCPCTGDEGYDCGLAGFHCSAMNILNKVSSFTDKGVPHAWNDLDALEVGNGGMSDEEYKTHFTMWAAVKSPLIMGNDVRSFEAQSLSILTNPAVLAISQDPAGSSVTRRWRYYVPDTDQHGQGEIQMWSGDLENGDAVAILLNAGNNTRMMNATLKDIFLDSKPKALESWDMYDLWANRMPDVTANAIINGSVLPEELNQFYYNATQMSFADGLAANNPLLFGKLAGKVGPGAMATMQAMVPSHGVMAYRLRQRANTRSEL